MAAAIDLWEFSPPAVFKSNIPVLVDFWAPWCQPCHMVAPVIEELAQRYAGRIKVVKVNVDEANKVASSMDIRSIPTITLFNRERLVDQRVGVQPKGVLEDMIEGVL